MSKKLRLILPRNIGKATNQWQELKNYDGKTMRLRAKLGENYLEISPWSYDYPIFKVFYTWVEEIKEEDATYDVAAACLAADGKGGEPSAFEISLVSEGEKLERKKHKPEHSWEEAYNKMYPPESNGGKDPSFRLDFRDIWQACEKNRGYDE